MQPINIDFYNDSNRPVECRLNCIGNTDIIQDTTGHLVTIEKCEIPINNGFSPIHASSEDYKFYLFNESKVDPDFDYGITEFSVSGTYNSVEEFLKSLNDIILKKMNLGAFIVDEEEMISFTYSKTSAPLFETRKLYFDNKIMRLLTFNYNLEDVIKIGSEEYFHFNEVTNFTSDNGAVTIKQKSFTYPKFFNLKAIRIYSTLPVVPFLIHDMATKRVVNSDLLSEITFNSEQSYKIKNLIYIPNQFKYRSLLDGVNLKNFYLKFSYKYSNGSEYSIFLNSFDYASITLNFVPGNEINEEIISL